MFNQVTPRHALNFDQEDGLIPALEALRTSKACLCQLHLWKCLFPSLTNASSSAGSTPGEVAGRNNCFGTGTKFRNGNRLNSHNARLGSIHL